MKMLCAFGRVIEMMHNMKEWLLVEEMNTKSQKPLNLLRKKNDLKGCSKKVFSSIQWIIEKLNRKSAGNYDRQTNQQTNGRT